MMRLGSAHEGDWRRVAEIVDRVTRYAENPSRFGRGHDSGSDNGRVGLKHLNRSLVLISFWLTGRPYVCFAVFTAADDIFGIVTERGVNLTARILIAFEFELQAFVS